MFRNAVLIPVICLLCTTMAGAPGTQQRGYSSSGSVVTPQLYTTARERLRPYFERQRIKYPPSRLRLVATKQERRLKLYSPDHTGEWRFLLQYPIAGASGTIGPKLRRGDEQVPEGLYRVVTLNPGSKYHLSLGLNYPNEFDRERAKLDKRTGHLGSDIMIHGKCTSTGCVAVGDTAAEDLYVLVSDMGTQNVDVILTPLDFRTLGSMQDAAPIRSQPTWVIGLYKEIARELKPLGSAGISTTTLLVNYGDTVPPVPGQARNGKASIFSRMLKFLQPNNPSAK